MLLWCSGIQVQKVLTVLNNLKYEKYYTYCSIQKVLAELKLKNNENIKTNNTKLEKYLSKNSSVQNIGSVKGIDGIEIIVTFNNF